jgi:hypothetical protein
MAYVGKGVPRGKKSRERFYKVLTNQVTAHTGEDLFLITSSGATLQVESEAGATLLEIDDTTGLVSIGSLDISSDLEVDSISASTATDLEINGADGSDVKVVLGDDDGGEYFIIEEVDGDDLFKVDSTGLINLVGGASIDNTTATTLNISETNIRLTGAASVVGSLTVPYGSHTGILIADLTATFGDPATLSDGFTAVYKNTTDSKIYTVHVVDGAYYLHEATAAAAA